MVNTNCPTAIYKILSYISPLPGREPFDIFNFTDKLEKTSSSGLFFNPKVCLFVSCEKKKKPLWFCILNIISKKMLFIMMIFMKFPFFCRCSAGGEKNQLVFVPPCRLCCPLQRKQRFRSGRLNQRSALVANHELHKKPPTADFLPQT